MTSDDACQDGAPRAREDAEAVDGRGRRYVLEGRGVRVSAPSGHARWIALDDPAAPRFLALPRIDLSDGRPLRDAAFGVWAAHVRDAVAAGASFETSYRPRRPFHTAFGVAGGLLVGCGVPAVLAWAVQTPRRVWIEPSLLEWAFLLAAVALVLWIANEALSTAVRLWTCRRGSFLRVSAAGVTVSHGARPRPLGDVRWASYRPWVRATHLALGDGTRVAVPAEEGPLSRPDLVLAALDDGVRERSGVRA